MASTPYHRKPTDDALMSLLTEGRTAQEHRLPRRAVCADCALPFTAQRPPVLLKSGRRVHVDCYFLMQKTARHGTN